MMLAFDVRPPHESIRKGLKQLSIREIQKNRHRCKLSKCPVADIGTTPCPLTCGVAHSSRLWLIAILRWRRSLVDNIVVCIALGLIGQAQVGARHVFKIRLDRGIFSASAFANKSAAFIR